MGYTGGADLNQLGEKSLLRLVTDRFINPRALDTDFFVASVDPDTLAAGDNLTLTTAGDLPMRHPRRVTVSVTDASYDAGNPLSVTVRVTGQRQGRAVVEDITATATSGSILTVTSDKLFSEVTQAKVLNLSGEAAGDALIVGLAGAALGLSFGIKSITDVVSIINIASGTEANATAVSSTTVDVENSCVQGLTIAATDNWEVTYIARFDAGIGSNGVFP